MHTYKVLSLCLPQFDSVSAMVDRRPKPAYDSNAIHVHHCFLGQGFIHKATNTQKRDNMAVCYKELINGNMH
jgi:hypothetical protein